MYYFYLSFYSSEGCQEAWGGTVLVGPVHSRTEAESHLVDAACPAALEERLMLVRGRSVSSRELKGGTVEDSLARFGKY